jgi:hypothetical protein
MARLALKLARHARGERPRTTAEASDYCVDRPILAVRNWTIYFWMEVIPAAECFVILKCMHPWCAAAEWWRFTIL